MKYLPVLLCLAACKKEEPDVIKLDYTNLYESAAYALVSARENYNHALQSKNPGEIEAARKKLQNAENIYSETKGNVSENLDLQQQKITEKVEAKLNSPAAEPVGEKTVPEKTIFRPAEIIDKTVATEVKTAISKSELRKKKSDSLIAVRKANYEAFKAKAKSDLQKDTVKNRLNRFNKSVKDFFEGKIKKK